RHRRVRVGQGAARALVVHRLPGQPGGGRRRRGRRGGLGGRRADRGPLPHRPDVTGQPALRPGGPVSAATAATTSAAFDRSGSTTSAPASRRSAAVGRPDATPTIAAPPILAACTSRVESPISTVLAEVNGTPRRSLARP